MNLSEIGGVFSRYFVVGFFVPAFFGLASASLLLSSGMLPDSYVQYSSGADWYRFIPTWLYVLMLRPEQRSFDRMQTLSSDANAPMSPRLYELAGSMLRQGFSMLRIRRVKPADASLDQLRRRTQT